MTSKATLCLFFLGLAGIFSLPRSESRRVVGYKFTPKTLPRTSDKVDFVRVYSDPSDHYYYRELVSGQAPVPRRNEDGSIQYNLYKYDKECTPLFRYYNVRLFPSIVDCQSYYRIQDGGKITHNFCPGNSLYNPYSFHCISFLLMKEIPGNCFRHCPSYEDIPIRETGEDIPIRETGEDIPIRETGEDIPIRETGEDIPIRETGEDIPIRETGEDIPIRETGDDIPIREIGKCKGGDCSDIIQDFFTDPNYLAYFGMKEEKKLRANDRSESFRRVYESSTEDMMTADGMTEKPLEIRENFLTLTLDDLKDREKADEQSQPKRTSRFVDLMGDEDDLSSGELTESMFIGSALESELLSKSNKYTVPFEEAISDAGYDEAESSSYYATSGNGQENYVKTRKRRSIDALRKRYW